MRKAVYHSVKAGAVFPLMDTRPFSVEELGRGRKKR